MKTKTGLTPELAKKEVEKWLDIKKVGAKKRERLAPAIEKMSELFEEGILILDESTGEITQNLKFEVGESKISKLVFKPRLTLKDTRGLNHESYDVKVMAALTGQLTAIIDNLDSEDLESSISIISFF